MCLIDCRMLVCVCVFLCRILSVCFVALVNVNVRYTELVQVIPFIRKFMYGCE